jgi:integrase
MPPLHPHQKFEALIHGVPLKIEPISRRGRDSWQITYGQGSRKTRLERSSWAVTLAEIARIKKALGEGDGIAARAATHRELVDLGLFLEENPQWSLTSILSYIRNTAPAATPAKKPDPVLFAAAASQYISALASNGTGKRHLKGTEQKLQKACRFFKKPLLFIEPPEIEAYLKQIKGTSKTRLNHRTTLVGLFRWAAKQGHIPPNLLTAADRTAKPKLEPKDPEIYTVSEAQKLLDCVTQSKDSRLIAFLTLGLFAGLRSSEILRLRWSSIKTSGIHLSPKQTKTSRRRVAEIPTNLQAWLAQIQKTSSDAPVTYTSTPKLYAALKQTVGARWKPNAMRHSFVSYHLELHKNAPRTAKTTGHSVQVLESHYLKLVEESEAAAYFGIFPKP